VPPLLPKGLSWTLDPGADLVVQLHFQPSGKAEQIRPTIGLYFGNDPPERTPSMIRLGRQNIDIPAGAREHVVTDSYVLPVDVEVQAVQPHAHFRARDIRGIATLPDGSTRSLIHIADWNFRWQHVYRYVKPFSLPRGTKLEMRYVYDNSADNINNIIPPVRVLWGQRSSDEMGDLWIQVLTSNERDRQVLNSNYQPKMLAEDIIGTEMRIRAEPDRIALRDDAALLYLATNQPAMAVSHFRAAETIKPDTAVTHFNLATALTVAGGQVAAQARASMWSEAVAEYRRAIEIRPDYAAAHTNLGSLQLERGNAPEAVVHLTEAVRLDPQSGEALYGLGRADRAVDDRAGAIQNFRRALDLRTNWAPVISDLAFLLAASPEDNLRNGTEALRLAQLANALTGGRDPAALDVLAAAYAETGQFDSAVQMAQVAVQSAPAGLATKIISDRLALYKQKKPYRIP
jgi:tetratricopeptide (TPR) repeat protein